MLLGTKGVRDIMLGNMELMDIAEICRRGKGWINEKCVVIRRCFVIAKASMFSCLCMSAVFIVLFLLLQSFFISVLPYFFVCTIILTNFIAYNFDYERRFNERHPIAVAGKVLTGIFSVEFMLWVPSLALFILQIYYKEVNSQSGISAKVCSMGWVFGSLVVLFVILAITIAMSVLFFVIPVWKCRVELVFDRGIDNFENIFVLHFSNGKVRKVDLEKYAVRILDTRNTNCQDIELTHLKKIKKKVRVVRKEKIAYIQNCSYIIKFDSKRGRWCREQ